MRFGENAIQAREILKNGLCRVRRQLTKAPAPELPRRVTLFPLTETSHVPFAPVGFPPHVAGIALDEIYHYG